MDNFIAAIVLAIVQGLTEWLPVSSSGHLVLFHNLLNYEPGLMFDVAVHFGTLMAVFVYFGRDIVDIAEDFLKFKRKSPNFKLGLMLIVASVPAALIGFAFQKYFELAFSSLLVVAFGFAITAMILFIASIDFNKLKARKEEMGYWKALGIGCAQALAIFPGISRSGSTISAGLFAGLNEKDAIKFSFLLAAPAIFGASILEIGNNVLPREMIWATLAAFAVGLLTIHLMLKIIATNRKNLRWFAVYCLMLALALFTYLLFW